MTRTSLLRFAALSFLVLALGSVTNTGMAPSPAEAAEGPCIGFNWARDALLAQQAAAAGPVESARLTALRIACAG
jgi:hypothetical protein